MLWTDVGLLAIEARRQGRTLSMRKNEKLLTILRIIVNYPVVCCCFFPHFTLRTWCGTAANKTTHFSLLFYFSCGRTAPQ
ncbi:Uncharacterized protein APZ42_030976 [Daphnia magna]|uniref:Uncharacterized protein n=1 Tax=Daphnia magna TaxID=35525 RepID=A0A164N893_9CRUS|nr:Uncharacterized protein APZ42_030976 [Daphnia magna]